ncbi:MAG: GNAT family N-acetyltransferase, partial [Eubacteriales bacterium]
MVVNMGREEDKINTERLKIRLLEEKDADFIVKMRNQKNIIRYFLSPHGITKEEHLQWFQTKYLVDNTYWKYIVEERNTGNLIGNIGIRDIDVEKSQAEVEYMFLEEYQGKGYACEAVAGLCNYATEQWGIKNFTAVIHVENKSSEKLVENLG